MRKSRRWILILLPTLLPLIIGASFLYLYHRYTSNYFPLGLQTHKVAILGITASFSFTLLGFLAAALALFFTAIRSNIFEMYTEEGYFHVFIWRCYHTIVSLAITFILSILSFSKYTVLLDLLFIMIIINLVQFTFFIIPVINIVGKAAESKE